MSRWQNSCQNVVLAFPWDHMNKCLLTPGRTPTADQSSKSSLMNQCSKLGSLRGTNTTKAKCPTSSLQRSLAIREGSCGPGKPFSHPWENARSLSSVSRLQDSPAALTSRAWPYHAQREGPHRAGTPKGGNLLWHSFRLQWGELRPSPQSRKHSESRPWAWATTSWSLWGSDFLLPGRPAS